MCVQYVDETFSDNLPFGEAVDEFESALQKGVARALFVGTEKELNTIKEKEAIEDELLSLKYRLEKLEQGPVKSDSIVIPTRDEMIRALRR